MRSETYSTPGPLRLNLAIPAGEVEIETVAGDTTHLELEARTDAARELLANARIELRERPDGNELLVEVPSSRPGFITISIGRGPEFRARVTCPPGAELEIHTKSADLRARGEFGASTVKTASGDVHVDEIRGDAEIKTASGDVSLEDVHGRTHVQTASGDLSLQHAGGSLTGHLVSGDVWVRDASGDVSINTVSGDQRLDAVVEGPIELVTVSGDIQVGVRRGSRVYVDCSTISGETVSELELSDAPREGGEEGPLVELRAKTVSGDIVLRRASAPAPIQRA